MKPSAAGHRIDIRTSPARVRVGRNGIILADSSAPVLLEETGLPARYYLPPSDVRMDLLIPNDTRSECPFKGTATYWSVRAWDEVVPDGAWCYREPIPDAAGIAGLVCFYNERFDFEVDGQILDRPVTRWSASS